MSIKAMTWAFGLPLEPRAKIALLAIGDNADDEGIAWPSRDTVASKSSQSRATVQRRLKTLEALGVLACFARYREDGTQTTDEIRLNLAMTADQVLQKMHDAGSENDAEAGADSADEDGARGDRGAEGGGCQADTPPMQSCNPTVAVVTGGGLHSGNPQDEPSLEPSKTPPYPPPGGRVDKIEQGEPDHFDLFFTGCLGWRTMDRGRALQAFRFLTPDEQGRARAASPLHAAECEKHRRKSKDAHRLIAERFWDRYPDARPPEQPPDPVWIDEGPDIDALRVLGAITDLGPPKLIHDEVKGIGLLRRAAVPDDLRALASFAGTDLFDWEVVVPETRDYNAWRHRLHEWTGVWLEPRVVMRRGTKALVVRPGEPPLTVQNRISGIPVPCRWPPKKDGTFYSDKPANTEERPHA